MSRKSVNKKLKKWALALNIFQIVPYIVFQVIIYRLIAYKDYLVLDYVPMRLLVIGEILLTLIIIIPFVIKWGKKRTIASIVISSIMIIALTTVSIFCVAYDKQLKNIVVKADATIDKVIENAQLSTEEYGVYVLVDDPAQTIEDLKEYRIGYCAKHMGEDGPTVTQDIMSKLSGEGDFMEYEDAVAMAKALIKNKKTKAIVLNQALMDLIDSVGEEDKELESFSSKIRPIYTMNIEKVLEELQDPGNITDRCFNVYISGIDTEGYVTNKSRSDVNIIMSINPMTKNIVLISTPRDFYVELSISNGAKDKLTHAGNYGVEVSMETLEMLYDINIDYYLRMNFTGFENIIDALGGIDVESEYAFSTHGYSYNSGWNYDLSGIEALWFARERKTLPGGDRQRGKNQMEVIEAVIDKCQSMALLQNYDEILNNVSTSFQTNMSKESIQALVKFQLDESPDWNICTYSVTGTGTSNYTYSIPSATSYVMEPDLDTVDLAKTMLKDNEYGREITEETTTE